MSNNLYHENNYVFNYSQYKKSINKKNNFAFTLIFLLIIILLGLCVFLYPKPNNFSEFHFVEIDNFQTYKDAVHLSQEVSASGGAGYVYFDGTYHVLASFYSNSADAEKVVENLKSEFENVQVFSINCKNFSQQKNLSSSQNDSIESLIIQIKKIILQLEEISIKFETKNCSFNEAILTIKNDIKNFSSSYDNFLSNFKTDSKYNKAKDYTQSISSSFLNLLNSEEQSFSASLRYCTVHTAITLTQFTYCF